eukprot:jgi/Tetstr1/429808/TSEL_019675.t1
MAGYWLRSCTPSEVEAFADAVDATVIAAVERVLEASFDPSTYGTDTNPDVVTDILAELLHNPDDPEPTAAEAAYYFERGCSGQNAKHASPPIRLLEGRWHPPHRYRPRCPAFIGCMNGILPKFLTRSSVTNTPIPSFFDPRLESVLGRGSFIATSSARQLVRSPPQRSSWVGELRRGDARGVGGRLWAATTGHLRDAAARVTERDAEAASGSQKDLAAFVDHANNSRL